MARNTQRGRTSNRSHNNNPDGRNQYSGVMGFSRERPVAAAAAAAAAVGAGVFLWSRRSQISDQISNLSDQFSDWSENYSSGSPNDQLELAGVSETLSTAGSTGAPSRRGRRPTGPNKTGSGGSGA
jgi:hypothetical protein